MLTLSTSGELFAQEKLEDQPLYVQLRVAKKAESDLLLEAKLCSLKAASIYAEMTDEPASTISKAAIQRCRDQWDAYIQASCNSLALDLQVKFGERGEELAQQRCEAGDMSDLAPAREMIDNRIVDWRAGAKAIGPNYYASERKRIDDAMQTHLSTRGY
ncbi:hypothetical protein [Agrobacterium sp. M50-1]|uniref:hypothetical protein n=1 Tax=Agrobacterium sp. M50-1 TaxID=3132821 RepID=UPI003CE5167D